MKQSPHFSSFRPLLDLWTEHEERLGHIRSLIDGNGLLLFFRKNGNTYGAGEEGRIVFAKMLHPDEDTPEDWVRDASFTAFDLLKSLTGDKEQSQCVFSHKDLGDLEMVDRDSIEQLLASQPVKAKSVVLQTRHGKEGAGKIKLRDKK